MVAVHPRAGHGFCFRIGRLLQSNWLQQPLADLVSNAVFRDLFDDHPDKQVVGIAISIAFSGRKIGFLLHSPCDERARVEVFRDLHIQRRELWRTVGLEEAATHIAELAHGDALGIRYGNPQRETAKRVVEAEFFFAYQLEKDANDERLRIAADAEMISRSERHFLFKIGIAECTDEAVSFGIPDADQSGRNGCAAAVAFAIFFDGCHDRGLNGRTRHGERRLGRVRARKSNRLHSSHWPNSYAVLCLKKQMRKLDSSDARDNVCNHKIVMVAHLEEQPLNLKTE